MTISAGTHLGPYEVVAPLGTGGMGQVYRARDPRLGRDVAIKLLPEHLGTDAAARDRFLTEMRAIAALNHENILAIHDVGESDGTWFAVIELVEGQTLLDRLRRGVLTLTDARSFAMQIARALVAAHARGVVHGDLKPANVMVTDDGRVKLVDFGLATRPVSPHDRDETRLVDVRLILGTPGYMSPEQARSLPLEPASDIFSFGVTLYEMLTGRHAFEGETGIDLISAVLHKEPVPLRSVAPATPASLAAVVDRCLQKRPSDRYASAADLLAALTHEQAARDSGSTRLSDPGFAESSIAVLPFADLSAARDQEYFCDGMAEEIITALARVPGVAVASRTSAFQFRARAEDVRQIGAALGVGHVLEGSVRKDGSRLRVTVQLTKTTDGYHLWSERFDGDVSDVFAVQDEIAKRVVAALVTKLGTPPTLVRQPTPDVEAYALYLEGRHHWNRRTIDSVRRSLVAFQQAIDRDPSFAQAHAAMAEAYITLAMSNAEPPRNVMEAAKRAAERAVVLAASSAAGHAAMGAVHVMYDWDWRAADEHFRQAFAETPGDPTHHPWHAMLRLTPHRRFDEALEELQRVRVFDPLSLPLRASISRVHYFAGRPREALAALDRVLELDPTFALAHLFRAEALIELESWTAAAQALDEAVRHGGEAAHPMAVRAYLAARSGDVDTARADLDHLLQFTATGQYVSPVLVAQVHVGLRDLEAALGALDHAAAERATHLVWAAVHPAFAPLRGQPRFDALLRRIGTLE